MGHPSVTVEHDAAHSRFVVRLPDGEAELLYAPFGDDVLDLQHTEVPPSGHGTGVADALVRAALAWAREQGMRVMARPVPTCRPGSGVTLTSGPPPTPEPAPRSPG